HGSRARVDVLPEALAAVFRCARERVLGDDARKILRIVPAQELRCSPYRFLTICRDRGEDEQARANVTPVAADLFAKSANLADALVEHLRRIHIGKPTVAVPRGTAHRGILSTCDPDRRMRLLHGGRRESDSGESRV